MMVFTSLVKSVIATITIDAVTLRAWSLFLTRCSTCSLAKSSLIAVDMLLFDLISHRKQICLSIHFIHLRVL